VPKKKKKKKAAATTTGSRSAPDAFSRTRRARGHRARGRCAGVSGPYIFRRPVRFDEVDAAGFVYFPKVIGLAHEALERMLGDALPEDTRAGCAISGSVCRACTWREISRGRCASATT